MKHVINKDLKDTISMAVFLYIDQLY